MARPYRCPICNGTGTVPVGFYSGVTGSGATNNEPCRACSGSGILWNGSGVGEHACATCGCEVMDRSEECPTAPMVYLERAAALARDCRHYKTAGARPCYACIAAALAEVAEQARREAAQEIAALRATNTPPTGETP